MVPEIPKEFDTLGKKKTLQRKEERSNYGRCLLAYLFFFLKIDKYRKCTLFFGVKNCVVERYN